MTEEKRPLKVFLCHAHSDKDKVRALYLRLRREGVDAWLDKEKLLPGSDWELEIRKAVREADVVVVCLSKQFNQAGFRQKEVCLALDTAMEQPEGEIFIVPARLEECENLESLSRWHWVDLFEDDGYLSLIRALRARADRIGATLRIRRGAQSSTSRPKSKVSEKATEPSADRKGGERTVQINWMPTDVLHDGKPYISIDITSKEKRLVRCYSYIKSLELNGVVRDDIKNELVKHTTRVSWSGGSGKDGIKHIDPTGFGKLNLASLDTTDFIQSPLQFETAKGPQRKDRDGNFLPLGKYTIELGLACSAEGLIFQKFPSK